MTKRKEYKGTDKKYHGLWQFPGGGINFGECPEDALKREIREELGIEIKINYQIPKILTEVRNNWQGLFIVYLCRLKNAKQKIILNKEASEYAWFELGAIKKLQKLPLTYEACENLVK